jgi:hypothetical protein
MINTVLRWTLGLTLILFLVGGAAASQKDLRDMLPDPYQGFSADGDGPYIFPIPDSLLDLYNGGYMIYVDRGVMSALSQGYYSDGSFYSVILHQINSPYNATDLVSYFRGQISGGLAIRDLDLGDGGFLYGYGQTNFLYFSTRDIFVTIEGGEGTGDAIESSAREIYERSVYEPMALFFILLSSLYTGKKYVK